MNKWIWLILILQSLTLCAQNPLQTSDLEFSSNQRIETLWQLADSIYMQDPQKALMYCNLALILSEKMNDMESQALSLNRISSIHLSIGQVDKALDASRKALIIYQTSPGLHGYVTAVEMNARVNDKIIRNLENDNVKVRQRYIIMFGILLVFISILFINMYQIKLIANRKLMKANSDIQHKNEELSNAYQMLDLVARKDPLTNLANRRDILEKLQYAQYTFERNQKPFTLIMADIDNFKNINDAFGHDAGDYALVFLSKLMQKTLRKQDIISRWGGDEFLLLLPDTDVNGGKIVAEKLRNQLKSKACLFGKHHIQFTLSSGVCSYTENGEIDVCIKKADEAMYMSKMNGRNQITIAKGR